MSDCRECVLVCHHRGSGAICSEFTPPVSDRCPTCGSDDPELIGLECMKKGARMNRPDPFHDPAPSPQEAPIPEAVEAAFDFLRYEHQPKPCLNCSADKRNGSAPMFSICADEGCFFGAAMLNIRTALATERKAREDAEKVAEKWKAVASIVSREGGCEDFMVKVAESFDLAAREAVKGATDE